MHLVEWIGLYVPGGAEWLQRIGPEGVRWLIVGQAAVYFGVVVVFTIWFYRKISRQKKFAGRWWRPGEYAEMMQILNEDQNIRGRVLSFEEKKALREYQFGDSVKPVFKEKKFGGYFG